MALPASIRVPWPPASPDVVVHTDVRTRDTHPNYLAAKSGDPDAAFELAIDLIADDATAGLREILPGNHTLLLPVIADETMGFNAIPDAMAQVLSRDLGLPVANDIVQTNKVGHTRAPTFQRIVTPAMFAGEIIAGASYILVDDHVGVGGTLASLRGYVQSQDATVIAMTALTESRDGRRISLRPDTLAMLEARHGEALDRFWRRQFGYGVDCLTEVEAQNLCRQPSLVAIENFLAKAAIEASSRGLEPVVAGRI